MTVKDCRKKQTCEEMVAGEGKPGQLGLEGLFRRESIERRERGGGVGGGGHHLNVRKRVGIRCRGGKLQKGGEGDKSVKKETRGE